MALSAVENGEAGGVVDPVPDAVPPELVSAAKGAIRKAAPPRPPPCPVAAVRAVVSLELAVAEPPPATVAVLITLSRASLAMFTVTVIGS